jgi:hypothetical protein
MGARPHRDGLVNGTQAETLKAMTIDMVVVSRANLYQPQN